MGKAIDKVISLLDALSQDKEWGTPYTAPAGSIFSLANEESSPISETNILWTKVAGQSDINDNPIIELKNDDDVYILMVESYYTGAEDNGSDTWVVFSLEQFPNQYWRVGGRYDSWGNENTWNHYSSVQEVFQKAIVRIVYDTVP